MVKVKAKRSWKMRQRALAKDVIAWTKLYYGINHPVRVVLVATDSGNQGSTTQLSDGRIFVWICAGSDEQIIRTIIHEMTHVKQLIDGRLLVTDEDEVFWRKEKYEFDFDCGYDYAHAPWEVEAFKAEDSLYWRYKAKNRLFFFTSLEKILDIVPIF